MERDELRMTRSDFLREHDKIANCTSLPAYFRAFATNFDGAAPEMAADTIATD
jgi:hypothetical protein